MNYFKSAAQAAKGVWNVSKSYIVDTRTPAQKLIDLLMVCQEQIIPTTQLNQLSAMTYQIQQFEQILDIILIKLKVFKYDYNEAHKTLNMLITVNYLLKHGATAFVDELRGYKGYFHQYRELKDQKVYEEEEEQSKLNYEIQKIRSRAVHIGTLLEDKNKLLKQKELSMLIKQKMKLYEKNKLSQLSLSYSSENSNQNNKQKARLSQISQQVENIMEKYLWKYVDKLDDKIQHISEKVLVQIDKYVIGESPEVFQFDQDQPDNKIQEDDDQFMKKLQEEATIHKNQNPPNLNLLEFQEVIQPKKQVIQEQLI